MSRSGDTAALHRSKWQYCDMSAPCPCTPARGVRGRCLPRQRVAGRYACADVAHRTTRACPRGAQQSPPAPLAVQYQPHTVTPRKEYWTEGLRVETANSAAASAHAVPSALGQCCRCRCPHTAPGHGPLLPLSSRRVPVPPIGVGQPPRCVARLSCHRP